MHKRKLSNISDEALIELYISEGMSKKVAEALVSLSSRIDKTLKDVNPFSMEDEWENKDDDLYGFEMYETILYPPDSDPPEEVNKKNPFHHQFPSLT